MSDLSLILHCSPTLANLKTGNLFSTDSPLVCQKIEQWNKQLNNKGVFVRVIHRNVNRSVIYVYRYDKLAEDLKNGEMQLFLENYGYDNFSPEAALEQLERRMMCNDGFPHEIGAFLGYPLNDIRGFIENRGHNCKLCGIWKVYDDVEMAQRQFDCYKKCRDVYTRLWKSGKTPYQLAVKSAASRH